MKSVLDKLNEASLQDLTFEELSPLWEDFCIFLTNLIAAFNFQQVDSANLARRLLHYLSLINVFAFCDSAVFHMVGNKLELKEDPKLFVNNAFRVKDLSEKALKLKEEIIADFLGDQKVAMDKQWKMLEDKAEKISRQSHSNAGVENVTRMPRITKIDRKGEEVILMSSSEESVPSSMPPLESAEDMHSNSSRASNALNKNIPSGESLSTWSCSSRNNQQSSSFINDEPSEGSPFEDTSIDSPEEDLTYVPSQNNESDSNASLDNGCIGDEARMKNFHIRLIKVENLTDGLEHSDIGQLGQSNFGKKLALAVKAMIPDILRDGLLQSGGLLPIFKDTVFMRSIEDKVDRSFQKSESLNRSYQLLLGKITKIGNHKIWWDTQSSVADCFTNPTSMLVTDILVVLKDTELFSGSVVSSLLKGKMKLVIQFFIKNTKNLSFDSILGRLDGILDSTYLDLAANRAKSYCKSTCNTMNNNCFYPVEENVRECLLLPPEEWQKSGEAIMASLREDRANYKSAKRRLSFDAESTESFRRISEQESVNSALSLNRPSTVIPSQTLSGTNNTSISSNSSLPLSSMSPAKKTEERRSKYSSLKTASYALDKIDAETLSRLPRN